MHLEHVSQIENLTTQWVHGDQCDTAQGHELLGWSLDFEVKQTWTAIFMPPFTVNSASAETISSGLTSGASMIRAGLTILQGQWRRNTWKCLAPVRKCCVVIHHINIWKQKSLKSLRGLVAYTLEKAARRGICVNWPLTSLLRDLPYGSASRMCRLTWGVRRCNSRMGIL